MDEDRGNKSGKQLDPLPASTDEFWTEVEAEVHTNIVPQLIHQRNAHYFIRMTGRQAQCNHCDWGFELDPGDKVVDGHVYERSGKLVI